MATISAIAPISVDSGAIYRHLLATLCNLLQCTGVAILRPQGAVAEVLAAVGPQLLPNQVDLEADAEHILALWSQEYKPLSIQRATPFPPPLPTPAEHVAWIGLPIVLNEQLFACVSLVGPFHSGDDQIAFALVQQATMSLYWAQHYAKAAHQAQLAQQLIELGQKIARQPDQDIALNQVLDTVMEAVGATHGYVVINQQGQAVILARRGYSPSESTLLQQIPPSLDRGLSGRAYQTRTITQSPDIQQDPHALPALATTRSQLVVPVCVDAQVLGLIDLQSPTLAAFQDINTDWLQLVGHITANILGRQGARSHGQEAESADVSYRHELLLSSRLSVVTDLAAGVAHEINNPLTSILGYTHLLLRDLSLTQQTRNDIGQIVIEAQRITALVERFLRFAQPSSNGKRPLAIDEPLLEAVELLKGRLNESGVQVILDIPDEPPMVLGQSGQLEQAFLDILQNAIEAMRTSDQRIITIQATQQNGMVRIAISDSGRGIVPDLLMRVFEPGFTTKVDKGISRGLGLGLYAAHTIIQDHWGRIEVQSQIWQGSTFTVCLPSI